MPGTTLYRHTIPAEMTNATLKNIQDIVYNSGLVGANETVEIVLRRPDTKPNRFISPEAYGMAMLWIANAVTMVVAVLAWVR